VHIYCVLFYSSARTKSNLISTVAAKKKRNKTHMHSYNDFQISFRTPKYVEFTPVLLHYSLVHRIVYNISLLIVMKFNPMINRELNNSPFLDEKRGRNFFPLVQLRPSLLLHRHTISLQKRQCKPSLHACRGSRCSPQALEQKQTVPMQKRGGGGTRRASRK
jgi:hypothetical protein